EVPYICQFPGCGSGYSWSKSLTRHQRTHTRERPYPCSVANCGMSFSRPDILDHQRTDTGEEPFACECVQKFSQRGNLAIHKRRCPQRSDANS
ncbi:hypothetical protein EJ06DRAFT_479996, partial [Trichodelitschia bisporula]